MSLSATIIIPTYEEAANIPLLINEVEKIRGDAHIDLLFMDDNSQDGSKALFESIKKDWVHYVIRTKNRGLSQSVVDGFSRAKGDVIVVMDADFSHPVGAIPKMITAIADGYDFVIGSRYIHGGSTDESWGLFRKINSWGATLLAQPLTSIYDPMTGFFAFRRSLLQSADPLNPTGYKIGLEMLLKTHPQKIHEMPYHFQDRKLGSSKLSFREQLKYIRHLRRLYVYKYPEFSHLIQFLGVGLIGTIVNLLVLTLFLWLGFTTKTSLLMGIVFSIVSNFLLNRRFSFDYARHGPFLKQFLSFLLSSFLGAVITYFVSIFLIEKFPHLSVQLAVIGGICLGMLSNYFFNRFVVFKKMMTPLTNAIRFGRKK